MDIESLVSQLGEISGNDMCRYMFIPNKIVDYYSLNRAEIYQVGSAYSVSKNVSYTKQPYIRLIYPFVSLDNNDDDVRKAFSEAIKAGVKDVVIGSNTLDYYKTVIPDFDESKLELSNTFTDFYSDFKTRFVDYNENKFLKQHKIKMFVNDIELRRLTADDYPDVIELYNTWSSHKNIHNSRGFDRFRKYYFEFIQLPQYFIYGLFFKGVLFTYGIINFHGINNHIAYEELQQSYNRNMLPPDFELNDETNKFVSNIGQIVYYYLYKYLTLEGVDTIHCAGSAEGNKTLLDYKMNLYKNKIDYYIYKF